MAQKKKWFQAKKITSIVSGVALVAGFLFLDRGFTGNVVLNNKPAVDVISVIGLLLVFCSAALALYTIRR